MSLNRELQELHDRIINSLPDETRKKFLVENEKLLSRFMQSKTLQVGATVPDVLFRDKELNAVSLKGLLYNHHVVLSFFRGTWCPYCNLELRALGEIYPQIRAKGALLLAVSPELLQYSDLPNPEEPYGFPLFTDLANKAASKFGLVFELPPEYREIYQTLSIYLNVLNGDDNWTLPVPATYIISRDGIVRARYINADYTQRMEPEDILKELDALANL